MLGYGSVVERAPVKLRYPNISALAPLPALAVALVLERGAECSSPQHKWDTHSTSIPLLHKNQSRCQLEVRLGIWGILLCSLSHMTLVVDRATKHHSARRWDTGRYKTDNLPISRDSTDPGHSIEGVPSQNITPIDYQLLIWVAWVLGRQEWVVFAAFE